ncbi:MAG: serine hydrolase domain-containing protein [Pseudomonadota bacterium]
MKALGWVVGAFLAVPVLGACGSNHGDPEQSQGLSAAEAKSIRTAVAASLGKGLATTYSLAIWRDGHAVFSEAFGESASGVRATTQTQFQIGSDTKKITALALMEAVDGGKLSLDQTVKELLPDLELAQAPGFLGTVTVRDLLKHTSGLFDYTPWVEAADDRDLADTALGRFADNEYTFMPAGVAYRYSNPDYSLAGLILEKLEGNPWAQVVNQSVLTPLGMQHTYARRDDMLEHENDVAVGYGNRAPVDAFATADAPEPEVGPIAPADEVDNAFLRPAGLVWSTPTDQVALLGFFIDGATELLSDDSRREMTSAQAPIYNHLEVGGYGYGLIHQDGYRAADGSYFPTPLVWHDGGTQAMTSLSLMLPEQRVAVSVLANGAEENLGPVADAALRAAAGARLPEPIAQPNLLGTPSTDLASYAGTYADPNLGEVIIRWTGAELDLETPILTEAGVTAARLTPVGNDLFSLSIGTTLFDISFYDGEDGTPHKYGVNREFVLTRE